MSRAQWEIEWRIREIAANVTQHKIESIGPDTRLIEDLDLDSLLTLEFVMELEDEFEIDIPDEELRQFFVRHPSTIGSIYLLVRERMGTERAPRVPDATRSFLLEEVPFTQLGPTDQEAIHEEIGMNREGYIEFRRRRDGMRCIQTGDFLLDAEAVSNAAYARFLNSVGEVPPEILAEWCGCDGEDMRANQFPLRQTRKGWMVSKGAERQPMILVSWYGAAAYSLWANECDWREYRSECKLPSEAQWEHAADGATEPVTNQHVAGATYSAESLPAVNVSTRAGMSPLGAHHIVGNVWQWCSDWYSEGIRSERGGSWVGPAQLADPTYRRGRPPIGRGRCLGFRCCL